MSHKKVHHEEHVDETWLIPYADMLTLLLALFIVMFAMSQVDKEKLQRMSQQFNVIFSAGSGVMEKDGKSIMALEKPIGSTESIDKQTEDDKMTEIKDRIEKEIGKSGYTDNVKVVLNGEGLEISIQDVLLFQSGEAEVIRDVSPLLLHISTMLNSLDNNIRVVGHTDNVPIRTAKFRSNWDLSTMRAINVMSFLVDHGRLKPERFSVQGYGEYSPKFDNNTEDGRAKNRRVEIFLVRKYPTTDAKTGDAKDGAAKAGEEKTEEANTKENNH